MSGREVNEAGQPAAGDRLHRPDGEHRRQPPAGEEDAASWWNDLWGHIDEHLREGRRSHAERDTISTQCVRQVGRPFT